MVIWSQQAVADLRSIHDFIARDSRYYAKKVVHDIRELVDELIGLPKIGRMVPRAQWGSGKRAAPLFLPHRLWNKGWGNFCTHCGTSEKKSEKMKKFPENPNAKWPINQSIQRLSNDEGNFGPPWRISSVAVLPDYCLSVTCNDGAAGSVDMSQRIFSEKAGIYSALKDAQLFNQVRIELGVLTWPNDADIDPIWLHEEIEKNGTWCVSRDSEIGSMKS